MSPEEEILKKYGTPIEGTDVDVESDILSKYGTPIKKKEDTAFALETGSLEFPPKASAPSAC